MTVVLDTGRQDEPDPFDAYRRAISETFVPLTAEPISPLSGFGCRMSAADAGPVQVSRVESLPHVVRRATPNDGEDMLKVILQANGRAKLNHSGSSAMLNAGDLVLYDTSTRYELEFPDAYSTVVLLFDRKLIDMSDADLAARIMHPISTASGLGAVLASMVTDVVDGVSADPYEQDVHVGDAVLSLLTSSFAAPYEPQSADPSAVLRSIAKAFIKQHLADPRLDVGPVAHGCRVSVRELHAAFADSNQSVAEYIRTQRLARCAGDLADSVLPDGDIAARWGWRDPDHFARLFRARYGVRPDEYRMINARPA